MKVTRSSSLAFRLKGELPPGPPLPVLAQTLACQRWPLAYFERCRARYGDSFTAYPVRMPPLVFLSNPKDIRTVIAAPPTVLHPGAGAAVISPLVGGSSFMLQEEEQHMCGRSAVMPSFQRKQAAEHAGGILELVGREIASWPMDSVFATHPRLRSLTLRVILTSVFEDEELVIEELHRRLLIVLDATASLVLRESWLRHLPGWHATWGEFLKQQRLSDELIFSLIQRRRDEDSDRRDLLDTLRASTNPDGSIVTDQQVRDHLLSVILAGHETTASELAWAFQLLAHNQQVQERLIEALANDEDTPYLSATVQEVLRDRPVFLFTIPRAVVQPIEIGGYTYRPPVQLLGCIYLLHHNPSLYDDPGAFRPERFLQTPRPLTWLPWGGGRKRCPGLHLANLEMQTVLRATLAEHTILPASARIEHARWRSVIVTPHAGSQIILHRRSRPFRRQRNPLAE
jgi:cytochrome P450